MRERSRWLALTVLCAAMMMIILDGTIVTVALPTIQRDLRFSAAGLAWVVNAYLIAFGGLLLLAGRLGDLIGGKRIFIAGIVVFRMYSVSSRPSSGWLSARFACSSTLILSTSVEISASVSDASSPS